MTRSDAVASVVTFASVQLFWWVPASREGRRHRNDPRPKLLAAAKRTRMISSDSGVIVGACLVRFETRKGFAVQRGAGMALNDRHPGWWQLAPPPPSGSPDAMRPIQIPGRSRDSTISRKMAPVSMVVCHVSFPLSIEVAVYIWWKCCERRSDNVIRKRRRKFRRRSHRERFRPSRARDPGLRFKSPTVRRESHLVVRGGPGKGAL